ncbi:MAG: ABC transporter permease subunit [Gammaproteobacteria bacterium]|jgi:ABC-2 type transport system permease protein|nr:ABC transporter permease subunit [Gammaproteobacteria bacterium]MBT3724166.1 ABC transporter permease subunit [Gammaproteobacteria bacterium]MBT4078245.1 ABC transporter permease subunit [Gammaproteobacteria bacterium]MBT4194755.1 ABC transporter permease subunit [Gammaproteobacteria bacterium]MBT4450400.1 ABC transporter permease subunit [Gammaproteobacteria bacterium]
MKHLWLTAYTDIIESLRARWFMVYSMVFGGIVVLLFAFGLSESRIMGFTGLSRLLVTYIQLSMAILPIFVLITTVRSVAGDREAGVFEYMLSLPVSLAAWFWGRFFGRFFVVFLPVFLAMLGAVIWGVLKGSEIPWNLFMFYTALLMALAWCFLGIGMLISTLARSSDVAQGAAFITWLLLLLFLDLILLGIMIQENLPPNTAVAIALANPMQVFRTATMMLFDPQLVLLGPTAYVILDNFTQAGYIAYAVIYPVVFGSICAGIGYFLFKRSDLP